MKNKERILIDQIKASVKTQARAELDKQALEDYTAAAKEAHSKGADFPFPEITVFRDPDGQNWLADGFHRKRAATAAGYTELDAEVKEGSADEAFLFACQANKRHGVRLSRADMDHNLKRVLGLPGNENLSNVQLGELAGVSEKFVRDHRPAAKAPTERKTKSGKTMNVSRVGKKGGKTKPAKKGKKKVGEKGYTAATFGDGKPSEGKPAAEPKVDKELAKAKAKIIGALGEEGQKLEIALAEGTLDLTTKDIKTWSQSSLPRIKAIAPLVMDKQWKPGKAYDFIDKDIKPEAMKISDAVLHCIAKGGQFSMVDGDYMIVVVDGKKHKVEIIDK